MTLTHEIYHSGDHQVTFEYQRDEDVGVEVVGVGSNLPTALRDLADKIEKKGVTNDEE